MRPVATRFPLSTRAHLGSCVAACALLTTSLALVTPRAAHACSCAPPSPPEIAIARAAAVFEGRTYGVHRENGKLRFSFEVLRVWKGSLPSTVDVWTASDSAACGRGYEAGVSYVIYAHELPGGQLGDGMCSRSRPTTSATEDLAVLGGSHEPQRAQTDPGERPAVEPPRIETAPPPLATPPSRGCAIAGPPTPLGVLVLALVVARSRRRARPTARSRS